MINYCNEQNFKLPVKLKKKKSPKKSELKLNCIVKVIDVQLEHVYNVGFCSELLTANIYFIVNSLHLKMMKDKLSRALFQVLDLCS